MTRIRVSIQQRHWKVQACAPVAGRIRTFNTILASPLLAPQCKSSLLMLTRLKPVFQHSKQWLISTLQLRPVLLPPLPSSGTVRHLPWRRHHRPVTALPPPTTRSTAVSSSRDRRRVSRPGMRRITYCKADVPADDERCGSNSDPTAVIWRRVCYKTLSRRYS